ncbi:NmrA family NAD(P)-binding protein [Haloprofundus salilacus]|uniref:NmrA family NAD(P)-binding protein n=1 Tax=Haloprofundus salilacus TaxID=2876190 RepID=UPI001CCC21D3|nr:NmrA family NAD(P)-binding protein [Haloprofundus salilacus]
MTRRVLVANASGRLGKTVVEQLCSGEFGSFEVRALTDTLNDDAEDALSRGGATLVEADSLDADSLATAVDDVDAVFLTADVGDSDAEALETAGGALVDAAERTDLSQFVYASAAAAGDGTDVPKFEAVSAVERRVSELELPWTVVRPAFLMQWFEEHRRGIESGTLTLPLDDDAPLYLVHVDDVGAMVARVLADPDSFVDETLELAADSYTLDDLATAFAEALGHDVTGVQTPMDVAREELPEEHVALFAFVNGGGYEVDLDAVRDRYDVEFRSFETYLDTRWSGETAESSESTAD